MIRGIGEVLGFQAQPIATLVGDPAFPLIVPSKKLPAVKLNTRLIRKNTHDPSAGGFINFRCFSQFPTS